MQDNCLKIIPLSPSLCKHIVEFFRMISSNTFFHPHPFDLKEVHKRCYYKGDNIYCALIDKEVLAYGFIRGWDEGWDDKCLGIITNPSEKRQGLGELLVRFLHIAAKRRGLKRLRLHVSPDNIPAINLYKKTGYTFSGEKHDGELIGFKDLYNS